jgi:hypothetical protein
MKRLEQYMPIAIDVVEDIFLHDTGKVDDKLDNLVSRFGVAVRQMGLKTAVIAFSEKTESQSPEGNKPVNLKIMVTKAILRIIKLHKGEVCSPKETLKDYVALDESNEKDIMLKSKIMDASVALKLALRLFIESDVNDNEREEEENE